MSYSSGVIGLDLKFLARLFPESVLSPLLVSDSRRLRLRAFGEQQKRSVRTGGFSDVIYEDRFHNCVLGESEKALLVPVSTKVITGSLMSVETELN